MTKQKVLQFIVWAHFIPPLKGWVFRGPLDKKPTSRTILGLNGTIFCLSDVRPGVGPFLSIFLATVFHWTTDKVGIALGALDLTAAICQIPSGLIVDATKFKRFLILFSCLAVATGSLIILNFPLMPAVIAAQSLIGIAASLLPPSIAAITLGLVGRATLPKRISYNEMWSHAGNVFTAGIAALLAYYFGANWILYVVILFAAGSIFFLSFINPKEIDHHIARELPEKNGENPLPIFGLLKESYLLIFCFSVFLFHFSNAPQINLVGQLIAQKDPKIASLFMGGSIIFGQFVMIGVAYTVGLWVNKVGRKPIFLLGLGILPIRALLYTFTNDPLILLLVQLLDGIGAGIYGVLGVVIVSDIAKGSGRFNFSLGLMALSQGLGASISNTLVGTIVNNNGFNAGFIMLSIAGIIGFCFYGLIMPETKNSSPDSN